MKNLSVLFIALGALFISCSSNDEPNTEPTTPTLVSPTNNLLCIDNILRFEWNASNDLEGDDITYRIEISNDSQFTEIAHVNVLDPTSTIFDLAKGETFFWRVRAVDDNLNRSEFSDVWRFYTQGEAELNSLPSIPELLNPSLSSTVEGVSITLEWEATDLDNHVLTYDLYLGTEVDPPLISDNLTGPSSSVDLAPGTLYYWKVVVKDTQGGITVGPVWNFSTE